MNLLIKDIHPDPHLGVSIVKSSDLAGDLAFRMTFEFPIHIMLSHPICKFKSRKNYPVREGTFIANLGLVPVFFHSMNVMTVMILYNERTNAFFSTDNMPFLDTETVCWEFPVESRSVEFSSMNFILQNGSEAQVADKQIANICKMYFDYGYWSTPLQGFVPSTHFLYSRKEVKNIVNVTKNLYVIKEIGNIKELNIEGNLIECREVLLKALGEKNGRYFFHDIYALMDKDLAEQSEIQGRLQRGFINAMVTDLRNIEGKVDSILTLIADYGDSSFELLQSLIGLVASKKYYGNNPLSIIGDVQSLKEEVFNAFSNIKQYIQMPRTFSDKVDNSFEIALKSLFPILATDDKKVYYTHPMLIGFIKKWDLFGNDQDLNRRILIKLLRLLEKERISHNKFSEIYFSEEAQFFQNIGKQKKRFTDSLYKMSRFIETSKIIDKVLRSSL